MMDKPVLLTADADQELLDTIAIWESIVGKTLQKGQPDYILCSILAYQKYLLVQRVNSAFCNMLIDFATAPVLDYIVALLGVIRTPEQSATCTLQFNLVEGHGILTISAGTRVSSSDGLAIFVVDEDCLVAADVGIATVSATCQSDGIIGNDYAIGSINTIMDVEPYISTCLNTDITSNGSDSETDEELRVRAKQSPSTFSTAGPRDAYSYFAKSVSSVIADISIITAQDDLSVAAGTINIYALCDNGIPSNNELNALIFSTLNDDKIRPLTDTVNVYSPTAIHYDLIVNITKLATSPILSSSLIDSITSILAQFKIDKYSKLGQDIVISEIESICRISGIYDLSITIIPPAGKELTGRNMVILPSEFAYLDNVNVSIIGSSNG